MSNENEIVINGVTYDVDEVYQRRLLVDGAEPTNYEQWTYINVAVKTRTRKAEASGNFQSLYRYDDLADLSKFHESQYPYYLDVKMVTVTNKKGEDVQQILWADFANTVEMELVPRNKVAKSVSSNSSTSSTSAKA